MEGFLLMHFPGRRSTKVLAIGVHCTKGMTVSGIAHTARLPMAKYTHILDHFSVKRSRVTPKEILLKVIAQMDTARPDAP
jgi:hypothetical protein